MSVDDQLAAAEDKVARAKKYHDRLLRVKVAESEVPGLYDTGETNMKLLSEQYGVSPMTIRRILVDAGREVHRFRKLSEEEREEVVGLLANGESADHIAEVYKTSKQTIRRVGIDAGVIVKYPRKPRRSDEDYLLILAFDQEARERFGTSLYNLGMGLRGWQQRKKNQARADQVAAEKAREPAPIEEDDDTADGEAFAEVHADTPPPQAPSPDVEQVHVIGDGDPNEDAPAVTGPFAPAAPDPPGYNF